ncbi:MAG: signal peptidase I [Pirellulales bacterium]
MSKTGSGESSPRAGGKSADTAAADRHVHSYAMRETVESIVIAVLLAFLFRTFVGEAFVIPTGSMAPTLQGNHKDVTCEKCGYGYQANASVENDDHWNQDTVVATTCPLCRYTMALDWKKDRNQESFSGDRILVSKFSYDLHDPSRWDVIVFKYPNNAKQNYIKRLVGLPGETIRVYHGDVYVKGTSDETFRITRKPPAKLAAMLQVVDDNHYIPDQLATAGWPSRWQPGQGDGQAGWRTMADDREPLRLQPAGEAEAWYRYRHIPPLGGDWQDVDQGRKVEPPQAGPTGGHLITDFYAYNAYTTMGAVRNRPDPDDLLPHTRTMGAHWVGDLALEAEVDVEGEQGELILELVEGGDHYQCRINVATGEAQMQVVDGRRPFVDAQGQPVTQAPHATTSVRGRGHYRLRFSNVDDELRLWVNGNVVSFEGPTTYQSPEDRRPEWSPQNLGDLAPAGVGTRGLSAQVTHLRVLRDVYYIAIRMHLNTDNDYQQYMNDDDIQEILADPQQWATTTLFPSRRMIEIELGADQFFPMGDNSPQSKDGRLWGEPPYVERELLTGKAVLVYWPHSWNRPIPFTPNLGRMRLIR